MQKNMNHAKKHEFHGINKGAAFLERKKSEYDGEECKNELK